jgi:hypothetical protein
MKTKTSAQYIPFATNFEKLALYDFSKVTLDEVIFLEYFIFKCSFMTEFFHSKPEIQKETGLTRRRLDGLISKYGPDGFKILDIAVKGYRKVSYYSLNFHLATAEDFWRQLYKPGQETNEAVEGITNFLINRSLLLERAEKKVNKSSSSSKRVQEFYDLLDNVYNERRDYKGPKMGRKLHPTVIARIPKFSNRILLLLEQYNVQVIRSAFVAYVDACIDDGKSPELETFLAYNSTEQLFYRFNNFLNGYNGGYSTAI